ncbi:MAG: preprotein translocase subunit Sec61beta [Halobacteriales archaeon]|nr:preprotein translocase subunit Sec61beta [Halobacteriales archaeon]
MAKKPEKGQGFQQAAGLIRYFDAEEETALKINPYLVLGMAFALTIIVIVLQQLPQTKL